METVQVNKTNQPPSIEHDLKLELKFNLTIILLSKYFNQNLLSFFDEISNL